MTTSLRMLVLRVLVVAAGLGAVFLFGIYLLSFDRPRPLEITDHIAFRNVNVVDSLAGRTIPGQTLLIKAGRITARGPVGATPIPAGWPVIEGRGRYLMPGLWDMHVHLGIRGSDTSRGAVMIANGVLYARDMNSDCFGPMCADTRSLKENRALQRRAAAGDILFPTLVGLSSHFVNSPSSSYDDIGLATKPIFLAPTTRQEGAQLAVFLKKRGVDFVKVHRDVSLEAYRGLTEVAGRIGLEISGHATRSVTLLETIASGQRSIEHAIDGPLACSDFAESYHLKVDRMARLRDLTAARRVLTQYNPSISRHYKAILSSQNPTKCRAVLVAMREAGTYLTPTHVTRWAEILAADYTHLRDPRAAVVDDQLLEAWTKESAYYRDWFRSDPSAKQAHIDFYRLGLNFTRAAYQAGIKIMVGTDEGDLLIYPGWSMHDEMDHLARAGLDPPAIVAAATINAAHFEGMARDHGSLDVGKFAAAVLTKRNPLTDIGNVRTIEGVYVKGRYYDRAALDTIVGDAAQRAKGWRNTAITGWERLWLLRLNREWMQNGDDRPYRGLMSAHH